MMQWKKSQNLNPQLIVIPKMLMRWEQKHKQLHVTWSKTGSPAADAMKESKGDGDKNSQIQRQW